MAGWLTSSGRRGTASSGMLPLRSHRHRTSPIKKFTHISGRPAVFLDRDGVINSLVYHKEASVVDSPFTSSQFRILPRVPQAIRVLNELGLAVIVVSNQPGIAKRHFSAATLRDFDRKLKAAL